MNLAFGREPDLEVRQAIADINTLRVEVAYPFLLELYNDYADGLMSRGDFIAILRLVESYVFRRAICGIPTNSLNKTFATLTRQIDKKSYLESFQAELLLQDSYRRFPPNDEFYFAFVLKDVYNFRSRNYLLGKLENHNHKEPINVEAYTIEHIMPQNQNLPVAWQQELGPDWEKVHRQYLHTIGNLTLTGYNPELSDRPFQEKRDMTGGFRDSHMRLNHMLTDLDHWNQAEIERRGEVLAGQALLIWAPPVLPAQIVDKNRRRRAAGGAGGATVEECLTGSPPDNAALFHKLRTRLLNFDASVKEMAFKERRWPEYHIAYQGSGTFVDVVLQKDQVRLVLNIPLNDLNDPKGMAKDVAGQGYWGGGEVKVGLTRDDHLDYVLDLIRQAFQYQEAQDLTAQVY